MTSDPAACSHCPAVTGEGRADAKALQCRSLQCRHAPKMALMAAALEDLRDAIDMAERYGEEDRHGATLAARNALQIVEQALTSHGLA